MKPSFYRPFASLIFTTALSFHVLADRQEATFYDNVDWAKSTPTKAYNDPNMALNLSDFCSDDNPGCESQIRHPDEAGMSDTQITDKSTTEFYSNEQAGAIQEGFDNNSVTIDPNDETYRFSTLGIDNAYEISHGQSNQYVDCDSGAQCVIDFIPKQCKKATGTPVPCIKTPTFTASLSPVIYTCPSGWTRTEHSCEKWGPKEVRGDDLNNCVYDRRGWWYCIWDGKRVSVDNPPYRPGKQIFITYEIIHQPLYKRSASLTCSSGYTLSGGNCVKNTLTWQTQCSLLKECKVMSQTCIEGRATRTINGIPTTLNCWKYQIDHLCDLPDTCSSLSTDCTTTSSACSLKLQGVCVEQTFQKSCPEKTCSSTNLICGDTSFCLDGDCFEEMPTTSDSFNENASALAALAEAADGIGDPPLIFTGKGMKCTDAAFGFADCCKDGGWGTDVGIAQCNEEEKALGQAKEQGITVALGSYCAKKVLGACTRKKKTYCVFDSKLARIIQEQGAKGQLGISMGSAKTPICDAITPEQLQQIDFERIDFSDFYNDMHDSTNLPSADEIQDRLQSAYGN